MFSTESGQRSQALSSLIEALFSTQPILDGSTLHSAMHFVFPRSTRARFALAFVRSVGDSLDAHASASDVRICWTCEQAALHSVVLTVSGSAELDVFRQPVRSGNPARRNRAINRLRMYTVLRLYGSDRSGGYFMQRSSDFTLFAFITHFVVFGFFLHAARQLDSNFC